MWKYLTSINSFNRNHIPLANTTNEELQTVIVELTNDLIEQYWCNTTLEKSICEVIANAYGKIMETSKKLNRQFWAEYLSNDGINFMRVLSQEQDRAYRNYFNAINNLIEIKKPQMNINIKTKNAYIWQNQQFNNNLEENEIIKD